jgi:hypothetical protein
MHAHSPWKPPRTIDAFPVDAEPDAADLGTAFGMECSLAEQASKDKPACAAPDTAGTGGAADPA